MKKTVALFSSKSAHSHSLRKALFEASQLQDLKGSVHTKVSKEQLQVLAKEEFSSSYKGKSTGSTGELLFVLNNPYLFISYFLQNPEEKASTLLNVLSSKESLKPYKKFQSFYQNLLPNLQNFADFYRRNASLPKEKIPAFDTKSGLSSLHYAVLLQDQELLQFFLERGDHLEQKSLSSSLTTFLFGERSSLLSSVLQLAYLTFPYSKKGAGIIDTLKENGANPKELNASGQDSLRFALMANPAPLQEESNETLRGLLEELIESGLSLHAKDKDGLSAYDYLQANFAHRAPETFFLFVDAYKKTIQAITNRAYSSFPNLRAPSSEKCPLAKGADPILERVFGCDRQFSSTPLSNPRQIQQIRNDLKSLPSKEALKDGKVHIGIVDSYVYGSSQLPFVIQKVEQLNPNLRFHGIPRGNVNYDFTALDGIILPGGMDSYPQSNRYVWDSEQHRYIYTTTNTPFDMEKLHFLSRIEEQYIKLNKVSDKDAIPLMGICLGHQYVGLTHGAQLQQVGSSVDNETKFLKGSLSHLLTLSNQEIHGALTECKLPEVSFQGHNSHSYSVFHQDKGGKDLKERNLQKVQIGALTNRRYLRSEQEIVQSITKGDRTVGFQFHLEQRAHRSYDNRDLNIFKNFFGLCTQRHQLVEQAAGFSFVKAKLLDKSKALNLAVLARSYECAESEEVHIAPSSLYKSAYNNEAIAAEMVI